MTECDAIVEANEEISKLKRENQKLNELCVKYGFEMGRLEEENEQLQQQIKDLRIGVLDSIRECDEIQCSCNPCIVEEYVKKVVE